MAVLIEWGQPVKNEGQPLSTSRGDEQGRREVAELVTTRQPGTRQQPIKTDEGKILNHRHFMIMHT